MVAFFVFNHTVPGAGHLPTNPRQDLYRNFFFWCTVPPFLYLRLRPLRGKSAGILVATLYTVFLRAIP